MWTNSFVFNTNVAFVTRVGITHIRHVTIKIENDTRKFGTSFSKRDIFNGLFTAIL